MIGVERRSATRRLLHMVHLQPTGSTNGPIENQYLSDRSSLAQAMQQFGSFSNLQLNANQMFTFGGDELSGYGGQSSSISGGGSAQMIGIVTSRSVILAHQALQCSELLA